MLEGCVVCVCVFVLASCHASIHSNVNKPKITTITTTIITKPITTIITAITTTTPPHPVKLLMLNDTRFKFLSLLMVEGSDPVNLQWRHAVTQVICTRG